MNIPQSSPLRSRQHYAELLEKKIASVLNSGWYILGKEVDAFEAAFAAFCGTEQCIGCANGTDAIELVLRAMGIRNGNHVATVATRLSPPSPELSDRERKRFLPIFAPKPIQCPPIP